MNKLYYCLLILITSFSVQADCISEMLNKSNMAVVEAKAVCNKKSPETCLRVYQERADWDFFRVLKHCKRPSIANCIDNETSKKYSFRLRKKLCTSKNIECVKESLKVTDKKYYFSNPVSEAILLCSKK